MASFYKHFFLCLVLVVGFPVLGKATHIVGGEMNYTCLGNNQYEITLTIFRDCYYGNPNAWFDDPASIGVFDMNNVLLQQVLVPLVNNDTLSPVLTSECLVVPPNVCVHTTTYRTTITLPPIPGGYQLAYQRCCRNQTIVNIIGPLDTGATYGVNISEKALEECNSNPKFQQWPPIYICVNEPIVFDQSAIDQDGDSIVYRLCTPLSGANPDIPMPQPPNNPPYEPVSWVSPPYGVNNMLNGLPGGAPLQIDLHTGLLTGLPNTIGQFVVGICVEEYRDGELISTTRRDFQYNVGLCGQAAAAFTAPEIQCESLTVFFQNQSLGTSNFVWNFNDPGSSNNSSTLLSPVHTFSDTGLYTVTLIAAPGSPCEDTAVQQIYLQNNTLFPDFEYEFVSCTDSLVIAVTDLTQDTASTISSWMWALQPGGQTSSEPNPTFVVTASNNYILELKVTAANGCEKTFVDGIPARLIDAELIGDTVAVCPGEGTFLNPNFNQDYTYSWAPAPGLEVLNAPNPYVEPLETATYTVTITDADGFCQVERQVTVLAPEAVSAQAPPDTSICSQDFLLQASSNTGQQFIWASDPDFNNWIGQEPELLVSPMGPVSYYLLVRDEYGCTATDSTTISGNAVDILMASEQAICPGDYGAVSVVNLDPQDVLSYSWSPASLLIAGQNSATAFAQLTTPGTYAFSVMVQNQYDCTGTGNTELTLIDTTSQLEFLSQVQCGGYTVQFSSSSVNAPFYQWKFGDPANPAASAQGSAVSYTYPGPGAYQVSVSLSNFIECQDTLVQEVVVGDPQIIPDFGWEVVGCGDSISLQFQDQSVNNQSAILSWEWFFGNGLSAMGPNPGLTLYESGQLPVRLLITSSDGCVDSITQLVPVNILEVNLPDSVIACPGQPVFLNPDANPALSYSWSPAAFFPDPAAPNPSVLLDEPQVFSVTITDAAGECQLERQVTAIVPPPITYELAPDTVVCEEDFLLYVESAQATDFAWSENPNFNILLGTDPELLVQPGPASRYYIRLTDDFGCRVVDSVDIGSSQIIVFLDESTSICLGDTARLTVINLSGGDLAYSWSPASAILEGQNTGSVLVNPLVNQEFSVEITNELGCMLTESGRIFVDNTVPPLSVTAEPDTLFSPGAVQLEATFDANYAYLWQPSSGLNNITISNPTAQVDSTATYTVRVVDENGCRNEALITIIVIGECIEPYIFVPNAFTPNGDNLNDLLFVEGNTIEELTFAIYDRWGEKVFETDDQSVGWDGTYKGRELSPDVYGYYLEVRCFNGEQFFKKGNITLIR
ncbi:MAG: gliding motility-associated C-terminal domain-containing protein [Lewinellaceae bacterium]|nr:gliding motility-associated C-terminal domain-containing protein [Lewinellaceae bacterium]